MHNRETERTQLRRKLQAGLSIHMPAPRRIGKTWTVTRLASDLRDAGWHAIEVDVQGMRTPNEFARELCLRIEAQNSLKERFKAHALQRIGNLLGGDWGSAPLDALGRVDPIEFAETLIGALNDSNEKTAVIIDEVAYFFLALAEEDRKAAHAFAYKLRALQQRYKNVRWLLTGSIGLDTIARRYELEGAFVDFETFVLEPFTPEEALSYMRDSSLRQQLNHPFDASDADFNAMFAELGWLSPYYLKMVANEVRPSIIATNSDLSIATKTDFDAAFKKLLQPNRRSEFAVWPEHIRKNLPIEDRTIANHILNGLCHDSDGETIDTLIARASHIQRDVTKRQVTDILAMLCNDGLLVFLNGRYSFRSGLITRYWREYEAD
jgi:hypothetical protein